MGTAAFDELRGTAQNLLGNVSTAHVHDEYVALQMRSLAWLQILENVVDGLLQISRQLGLSICISVQGVEVLTLEQVGNGKCRGARTQTRVGDDVYRESDNRNKASRGRASHKPEMNGIVDVCGENGSDS